VIACSTLPDARPLQNSKEQRCRTVRGSDYRSARAVLPSCYGRLADRQRKRCTTATTALLFSRTGSVSSMNVIKGVIEESHQGVSVGGMHSPNSPNGGAR
jgi:hypothetical protein